MVAAARAFGAREPDPSVRNPDYLAERFLGPAERELIGEHPIAAALEDVYESARQKAEVAGTSNMMLARTRFIDEHLARAVAGGASQVVILGAGFDTRAYRFAELLTDARVFEVDYRSTQQFKKRRVEEVLGAAPANVVFVEIDFQRDKLEDLLRAAGYRPGEKTFFIWEGVSMYLPESAVRETLRTVAALAPEGSSLTMDFTGASVIGLMNKFPAHTVHRFTRDWGEPWIFGVPEGREREFFRDCGLELREVVTFFGSGTRKRYLTRANGNPLGRGKRSRGQAPQTSVMTRLAGMLKMLWPVARILTSRSKGYAMAELVVPRSG